MKHYTSLIQFKESIIIIFLILFMAILPFLQTGNSGIIQKTDSEFPYSPINILIRYLWVWNPNLAMGFDQSALEIYKLPYFICLAFLEYVGMPIWFINRIAFIIPLFLMGSGIYLLTSTVTKGNKIASLVSAFFSMYNPIVVMVLLSGDSRYLLGLSIIPFMLAFLIKGLNSGGKSFMYVICIGILSLLIRPINVIYA